MRAKPSSSLLALLTLFTAVSARAGAAPVQPAPVQPAPNQRKVSLRLEPSKIDLLYAVRLRASAPGSGEGSLALTLRDRAGGTINLQTPYKPSLEQLDSGAAQVVRVLARSNRSPGKDDARGILRGAGWTSRKGGGSGSFQTVTPATAVQLIAALESALSRSAGPHSDPGDAAAYFISRLAPLANRALGSSKAQDARLTTLAERFDNGDHKTALASARRLMGSGDERIRRATAPIYGQMLLFSGRAEEAVPVLEASLRSARGPQGDATTTHALAKAYRSLRQFERALEVTSQGIERAKTYAAQGAKVELRALLFEHAVMEKSLGHIADAAQHMSEASAREPGHAPTAIAAAGYLALAGKPAEGQILFDQVPVPQAGTRAFVNWGMNATWYHGLRGDSAQVIHYAKETLDAASRTQVLGSALHYLKTEVDLDRYRKDPGFSAVIEQYDAMLRR